MKKISILLLVFYTLNSSLLKAQCPMCKLSAESNLKDGGTAAKGLNKGILFMLCTPYILVGVIGFLYWKNNKANQND